MMTDFITENWYIWLIIALGLASIYQAFRTSIKGYMGEKSTAAILSRLNRSKYSIINNLVLETRGQTSQIDHVVVSDFGIFVIEMKNYQGWIFGGEHTEYWTQVIYKWKTQFYSPVRQNRGHVFALKHHLRAFPNVKYIPIIVFSDDATLKITVYSNVTYSSQLLKVIKTYTEVILTEKEKDAIFDRLNAVNMKATYSQRKHIKAIRQKLKAREKSISQSRCPRCGNDLILRTGKFGNFTGCSNFPTCRFTVDQ
ncbi:NERD domain-containing protein [Parapedobacter tibetensis]|uniref:NERD domain-containing protein n=1 Tax=Parapedobacter tibetensis TaxID=2972951 RepID=UPI00214D753F|nr:NERD domain-containing protein [Parapedobacter tibetensis]